jgi:uncharacterized protein (DUF4415 family)
MTYQQRLQQSSRSGGSAAARARDSSSKSRAKSAKSGSAKSSREQSKHAKTPAVDLEMYRPLKKPITVRIDADVLAWFKKGGSHYQTRINSALRKVMEKEMKEAE